LISLTGHLSKTSKNARRLLKSNAMGAFFTICSKERPPPGAGLADVEHRHSGVIGVDTLGGGLPHPVWRV
jgi:hypothetical protein